jgi:hypothetical protein
MDGTSPRRFCFTRAAQRRVPRVNHGDFTMAPENATDQLKRELKRAVETLRADLDRVELLTAALSAFHRPVPDYEPTFHHTQRMSLSAHELGPSHDMDVYNRP